MNSHPLQESNSRLCALSPCALSPVPADMKKGQNENATVSIAETVSRSPIVPPDKRAGARPTPKSARKPRQVWSPLEDKLLADLLTKYGHQRPNWPQIAEKLNKSVETPRSGKQCRERFNNHLRPNIRKGSWTIDEEQMIRTMYHTFGPKWSCMAKLLKGRTDNDIKNKWYSMYRSGKVQSVAANASSNGTPLVEQPSGSAASASVAPPPQATLDFPPPFSLAPILPGSRLKSPNTSPLQAPDSSGIDFSYLWTDLDTAF